MKGQGHDDIIPTRVRYGVSLGYASSYPVSVMTDRPLFLVTGAAGGLGRAIATSLRHRGAALHLVDRDREALLNLADKLGATWTVADLTDDAVVPTLFDRDLPDGVVNAIGKGYFGTFDSIGSAQFRHSFGVNFFAPLFVGLEAMRRWKAEGVTGRLLTLSSISGHKAYSSSIAYCAAKHALESAMSILRRIGAESGIRVGTICPTNVDTPFWNAVEMDVPVKLPKPANMLSADVVVSAVDHWLDNPRAPGVVFVPKSLSRQKTRYGRGVTGISGCEPSDCGVALISGASAGLGRELARELRRRGWRLAAVARDERRLDAEFASDEGVLCCAGDVADAVRMTEIVKQTVDRFGGIDLLVNNAGSSFIGPALDLDFAVIRRVFETNFFGYFHLTKAALPHVECARGSILNIISTTALNPAICALPYSCAKIAQAVLSDRLRDDLAPRGVRVLDLFSSNIRTKFFDRAETPEGIGVQVPANAMEVGEVAEAAMALLDGQTTTCIVPRNYGRRTVRQWCGRVMRLLR